MSEVPHFTVEQARDADERIGIDWARSRFDVEEFRAGMDVELEHGTRDPETNVTDDDIELRTAPCSSMSAASPSFSIVGVALGWMKCVQTVL